MFRQSLTCIVILYFYTPYVNLRTVRLAKQTGMFFVPLNNLPPIHWHYIQSPAVGLLNLMIVQQCPGCAIGNESRTYANLYSYGEIPMGGAGAFLCYHTDNPHPILYGTYRTE